VLPLLRVPWPTVFLALCTAKHVRPHERKCRVVVASLFSRTHENVRYVKLENQRIRKGAQPCLPHWAGVAKRRNVAVMVRAAAVIALSALALVPAASASSWHTATFTAAWPGAGHAITYPVDLPRGTTSVRVTLDGRLLSPSYWISLTCPSSATRWSAAVFTALYDATATLVVSVSLHQGPLASDCLSGYAAGAASAVVVTYRH